MNKFITLLLGVAVSLGAYTVELDGIGTVEIPDAICDTAFVEEFVEEYNDYEWGDVASSYIEDLNGAVLANGDRTVALFNYVSATNFDVRFFIRYGQPNAGGWFSWADTTLNINAHHYLRYSRETSFYILSHELTHYVQWKEGELDGETRSDIIVNEIYADANAIIATIVNCRMAPIDAIRLRQTSRVLSRYAPQRARASATILIDAIILEQNHRIAIGG